MNQEEFSALKEQLRGGNNDYLKINYIFIRNFQLWH